MTGEVELKKKISDCVISVPTYYTDQQRRRLLEASAMANLNCLKVCPIVCVRDMNSRYSN